MADNPHLLRRDGEHLGEVEPDFGDAAAAAGVKGVLARRRIVIGEVGTRLHRYASDALRPGFEPHDMCRAGKCRGSGGFVADFDIDAQIAGCGVPQQRRCGRDRLGGARHRRQRLIGDVDQFRGVLGGGDALGDHESDRFADIAGFVGWQREVGGRDRREAAGSRLHIGRRRERGIVRDRPEPVGDIVGPGQHCERTGCGECCSPVDRDEARMRVWRAHEHRVRHPAQCDVVGKAASAGQQPKIFLAPHRLPDTRSAYRRPHPFLPSSPLMAAPLLCLPTHHVVATWTGNWAWIKHMDGEYRADFNSRFRGRLPAVT